MPSNPHNPVDRMPADRSSVRAFTLVELLVVIGIIALMLSILLPSLARARAQATNVKCLSNLRQLAQSCFAYAAENRGTYPIAYWDYDNNRTPETWWDFINDVDADGNKVQRPGVLFGFRGGTAIVQCPAYEPVKANGDDYTGYNYNTSYIGGRYSLGAGDFHPSARHGKVRDPVHTALFGDAGQGNATNRWMRAPLPSEEDRSEAFLLAAGAQSFRHRGATNVAFVDGHAESVVIRAENRFPTTGAWANNPSLRIIAGAGNGFLSQDNSAYDLK